MVMAAVFDAGALTTNVAGSNVRPWPAFRLVVAILPSVAIRRSSTVPVTTDTMMLLHVTRATSPGVRVTLQPTAHRSIVAGVTPPFGAALINRPSGAAASTIERI